MLVCALLSIPASAQSVQQAQIVASPNPTAEGYAVSLSDDGNTALIGAPCYPDGCASSGVGSGGAWVLLRSGGTWGVEALLAGNVDGPAGAAQGASVALSGDGKTAIVGGPDDCFGCGAPLATGAAWVFINVGGTWIEQAKLIGTANFGNCAYGYIEEGVSVALSYDGNVALVGGPYDNCQTGAAWVFTRSHRGIWRQRAKLVAYDAIGAAAQGVSVALSGDGKVAVIGGDEDNDSGIAPPAGATWVYTWSEGAWTEAQKLIGTGATGDASQGRSVAVSRSGDVILVGGPSDDSGTGAAWVFTARAGVWRQQAKLVGTGAIGSALQGSSVSLSGDGKTAMIGGPLDDDGAAGYVGAAWIFGRAGRTWTQASKLVAAGYSGCPEQGRSTALSATGATALVGAPYNDNAVCDDLGSPVGAVWAYTREPGTQTSRFAMSER